MELFMEIRRITKIKRTVRKMVVFGSNRTQRIGGLFVIRNYRN